jgi:tRNA 2-selenouridine synthase
MQQPLQAAEFLVESRDRVLLDVRSPGEYQHGHIPGAVSFPLFTDEERARVGTAYKQQGPEKALHIGLDIVGPKMTRMLQHAAELAPDKRVALHCWRGGQRSQSVAWLLRMGGFDVQLLGGGYKNYRHHVLEAFENRSWNLLVIGGRTGTGKTKVLHALGEAGEQIIDLEGLANHKGSAFGSLGQNEQPTVEQFENNLLDALNKLDATKTIWVENESRSIGRVYLPDAFYHKMKMSPLFNLEIPQEDRINNLVVDYALYPVEDLIASFERISKKLGGLDFKLAVEALESGNMHAATAIALKYYDKTYQHGLDMNPSSDKRLFSFNHSNPHQIASFCIEQAH